MKAEREGILNKMWGTLKEKEIYCVLHKKIIIYYYEIIIIQACKGTI